MTIGSGQVSEEFRLEAGRTVEKDIVVGVGRAVISMSYVAGMKVESGSPVVNVYKAAKRIDGSRERIRTEYGSVNEVDLPPGDYVAAVKMQVAEAEAPFSVTAGQRTEVDVLLDAGVLAIAAPEAKQIHVYTAQKDLQGKRVRLETAYQAEHQTTLNAGDYTVVVNYEGDKPDAEKTVTVKAGEREEITVP